MANLAAYLERTMALLLEQLRCVSDFHGLQVGMRSLRERKHDLCVGDGVRYGLPMLSGVSLPVCSRGTE